MTDEPQGLADVRSAAIRGLRWVMIARPLVECVLLGSMLVLARLISPAEFGHFAVANLLIALGTLSASVVTTALVQRPTIEREHLQAGFALALLAGVAVFGLMLLAAGVLVKPIFGARTAYLVRLSAPACIIVAPSAVTMARLQRRLAFRRLSVIDVSSTALRAVSTVGLAMAGLNGAALALGVLIGIGAITILSWVWAKAPPPRLRWTAARDLLGYALPAWTAAVSWVGFANCDYAIVGARLGAVQAGYYFRAYNLGVEYQKKVSLIMATVGFPLLARTSSEERGELHAQMVRLLTVMLFPFLALLTIVAPVAVPWLFGPAWRPAVVPTQILVVGGAATLVIDAVGATLMAGGRARAILGFGWGHFTTYALAVFVTAPLGLTAVAVSAAVVHTGFVFVAYFILFRGIRAHALRRLWEDIAPAVTSSAALIGVSLPISLAISPLHLPAAIYLATVTLAGGCAYVAALRGLYAETWARVAAVIGHLLPRRLTRRLGQLVGMLPASAPAEQ